MSGSDRLVVGWTCDDCDEAIGDEPNMWDLVERFRKEHEEETGHTTTVHVVREERIIPSMGDRMDIGEAIIEMADGEIDWICPECCRSGEELGTTKRCPDCDERLREVLPDGGEVSVRDQAVPTPWGPQTVPEIPCASCGTRHHPDATTGDERGQCRECGAFLRRPTEAEMRRFTDFIVWKSHWMEVENSRSINTEDRQ